MKTTLTWLGLAILLFTHSVHAQSTNYSPYYVKQGTQVFVSGPYDKWYWRFYNDVEKMRGAPNDPYASIETLVLVNANSKRHDKLGAATFINELLRQTGIGTIAIGRCDLFCSRVFIGGKVRHFGQWLATQPTYLDIQAPVDFESKKMDTRFPQSEFNIFLKSEPRLSMSKDLWYEAFGRVTDETGGLSIYAQIDPKFCASRRKPTECKSYSGVTAYSLGVTTSEELAQVTLPERFPAPEPTNFGSIKDAKALPSVDDQVRDLYLSFLASPSPRAFALNESEEKRQGAWASGSVDPAAKALALCETNSRARCRLYAVDDDVVWASD